MKKLFILIMFVLFISPLFSQEIIEEKSIFPYQTTIIGFESIDVFNKPFVLSEKLFKVFKGDIITLIGTESGWWKIIDSVGDSGFVMNLSVVVPSHMEDFRKEKLKEDIQKKYKVAKKEEKIGTIRLGDTKEMVIAARGYPNDINKSVGSWGVHEQWVYDSYYLYFENGILTSWQD